MEHHFVLTEVVFYLPMVKNKGIKGTRETFYGINRKISAKSAYYMLFHTWPYYESIHVALTVFSPLNKT